jgi:hypothetical protein
MVHITRFSSVFVATLVFSSAQAADCNLAQPRRAGDPSGTAVASDLRGQDNKLLQNVCNGGFPPGSDTISTWNTGSQVYNVTRFDSSQPLQYCFDAFENIITQCIEKDNYWGGDWKLGNEIYAIYDSSWPEHVLQAELESSASSPAPSISPSSAPNPPAGATVLTATIDGSPITQTVSPISYVLRMNNADRELSSFQLPLQMPRLPPQAPRSAVWWSRSSSELEVLPGVSRSLPSLFF